MRFGLQGSILRVRLQLMFLESEVGMFAFFGGESMQGSGEIHVPGRM